MSLWSRIVNVFSGGRLSREIDEELESHIQAAIDEGRDPIEARRAFGAMLRRREESRDIKMMPWLESLRSDAVFCWRQLKKKKITSAAAILSLGLAIGACTAAFRLIDALLLRPLPVAHPERLYALFREGMTPEGKLDSDDSWAYPAFLQMRSAVQEQADLIAVSYSERLDLTYKSDTEMEKAYVQYVSGRMFSLFGLRPVLGRLLIEDDDLKPGAHPLAVLSYDYWSRRFGGDPGVIGRTFRMGASSYEIIGVAEAPFTGTEPGIVTEVFVPTTMHPGAPHSDWTWFRTLALIKPGAALEPLRARLDATSRAFETERAKGFGNMSKEDIEKFLDQKLILEPAEAGCSRMQRSYRRSLMALGVLVILVLLIACANVGNLLTAQASARAREMALRVSIGAGRWRLIQLVLVESAWLAALAAAVGAFFAAWSAPFVIHMISSPDNPARLSLPADWRVLGFGAGLTVFVTLLFGLTPALRASAVKPASALKGGEDPHARHRLMRLLIAAQVAFCFLVLYVSGLFAATFDRLSHRSVGFNPERLLTLETVSRRPQPAVAWDQVLEDLRTTPGVESAAIAGWPLLLGPSWNNFVSIHGGPPSSVLAYFLRVSPGWADAMKISIIAGRDIRANEAFPKTALVNETFVRLFLNNENPIGKIFEADHNRLEIVGVVADAPYKDLREPILPQVYVPFREVDASGVAQPRREGTFIVRTSGSNPSALGSFLRQEISKARSDFRVSTIRTQVAINQAHTVGERLLAKLALFFAMVALVLAGVGVYGVLDYSVLQRRREIGIRMALGAQAGRIARGVTSAVFPMVLIGAIAGFASGLASVRYIENLLYEVRATDPWLLLLPWLTILAAALLAALPPVIRAIRIDPVKMLRAE